MRGKWLAEAGFIIDSYILVTIEHGRLEIVRDGYKEREKIKYELHELDQEKQRLEEYLNEFPIEGEQLDLFSKR